MSQKLTYHEQLVAAANKARKARNAEAAVYYNTRGGVASGSYEQFKGSWAYSLWVKSAEVIEQIADMERSFLRMT